MSKGINNKYVGMNCIKLSQVAYIMNKLSILSPIYSPLLECHNVSVLFHQLLLIGYKINVK